MAISIFINTDNATFDDPYEIGRILRYIADEIDNGNNDIRVADINGEVTGSFEEV